MVGKEITLVTSDGYALAANLFAGNSSATQLIVVASATGVPREYYKKFAGFLSEPGQFDALTFDYRGIGGSLKGKVSESKARMSDWGRYDLQAALAWGFENYSKVFLIGHSVAGQVFPLAGLSSKVSAAWFVGSQCAASHLWDGKYRLLVEFFWRVANPLPTKLLGYMPAFVVGGGLPLPKYAALEWRSWGLHRHGILQDNAEVKRQYEALKIPVHFVNIEDDHMLAPPRAVQYLRSQYANAQTSYQQLKPSEFGLREIGHFGFFKSRYKEKLWHLPLEYFRELM